MKTKQAKLIIRSPVGTFTIPITIASSPGGFEGRLDYIHKFLLTAESVTSLDENNIWYVLPRGLLEQSAFTIQDM